MGIFRIYPSKENTIASGSAFELLNSSQNPVANLWYGGATSRNTISRHLAYFDLSNLQYKLNVKEINSNYVTAYKLKFKNCVPSDIVLEPEFAFDILNKKVASSFDLMAFPINKSWDEGRGFDLDEQNIFIKANRTEYSITGYSNWISATSLVDWDEPGVFANPSASTSFNATQHFAMGSEDIDMDITGMVNNWLSGGSSNYGLAISYLRPYELISADTKYISSFFTNKTNTAYKPYIEVQYNQVIEDDRYQVANNRTSRLFLCLFSGNTSVNYFSAGTVSIQTLSSQNVYTGLTPVHHSEGAYYVDVLMTGTTKGTKYKDVWNNVTFSPGIDVQTFTQNFVIQGNYFTNSISELSDYTVTAYGLENNETLLPDEIRRIYVDTRMNYTTERPKVEFGLEYRITMNNVDEIIPWTAANTVVINGCLKCYFDLDTSWLLNNQTYQITLRINEYGTKRMVSERLNFRVIDAFTTVNF